MSKEGWDGVSFVDIVKKTSGFVLCECATDGAQIPILIRILSPDEWVFGSRVGNWMSSLFDKV